MKPLGIILIILVLVAVVGVGYLYFNAKLDIAFKECIATDGITQIDFFNSLKSKVESSTFVGTRYTTEDLAAADQYQFLTYTIHLDNRSFLNAEVIEIRITPMQGDVLRIGDETVYDLAPGKQTDLSVTILTGRSMHSVREATVSYYFWGIPVTPKLTLGK